MKKSISVLLVVLIILGSVLLTSCSSEFLKEEKGMKFVGLGMINEISDKETKDVLKKFSLLSQNSKDAKGQQSICILTKEAEGKVKIPDKCGQTDVCWVTAYPDACGKITSLKFGKYAAYAENICSFKSNNSSLKTVSGENGVELKNCFNYCSSFKSVELNTVRIENCFNHCKSLNKIEEGPYYAKNCFNDCTSLKEFSINCDNIYDSFCRCTALGYAEISNAEAVGVTPTGTKVSNSFNDCASLKYLRIEHDFKEVTDSFKNTGVNPKSVKSEEAVNKTLKTALDKLFKNGIIEKTKPYSKRQKYPFKFTLDSSEQAQLVFKDQSAKTRLLSEPDYTLNGVMLLRYFDENEQSGFMFENIDESTRNHLYNFNHSVPCKYIIAYDGFVSKYIKNYYLAYNNSGGKAADKIYVTTLVFVIDVDKAEVVSIHNIGTDAPEGQNPDSNSGKRLDDEAQAYIKNLLK